MESLVAGLSELDDAPRPPRREVTLVGRAARFRGRIALRAYGRGQRWLLLRPADVTSCRVLEQHESSPLVELRVALEVQCEVLVVTSVGGALATARMRRSRQRARAQVRTAAPFVLATPHHAQVAYNPPALGGNIPLRSPGNALASGGTDWLSDPLTLPEGPVAPPGGADPEADDELAPDDYELPKIIRDPITLREALTPPPPPQPDPPRPPRPPPFPPVLPDPEDLLPEPKEWWNEGTPPPPDSPFDWLEDLFEGDIKPTGQFGDPWGLDFQWDF